MAKYAPSRVISLRIEPSLLEAVRQSARIEGRSVSGQIVWCIREKVEANGQMKEPPKPISGWLSHRPVPETHDEFRRGRAEVSEKLRSAVRKKARAR